MEGARDLRITHLSVHQQCHGNHIRGVKSPWSSNSHDFGSADRDARKIEYSMRSSEYNAKNIIQNKSNHKNDVTSGCDLIPINMATSEYQPTPNDMECDGPTNRSLVEKNDSNSTTKYRKLLKNVTDSDDFYTDENSTVVKSATFSADIFKDKMASRDSHSFRTSIPSNKYDGFLIDENLLNKTELLVKSSQSDSRELSPRANNWNIPLGNSWGRYEFSHGTLAGVLSDILTEKSGMLSDQKTPSVYSSTGRKSRSRSFNGTGSRFSHAKRRNSTNSKKSGSSVKLSWKMSSDKMKKETSELDGRRSLERKRCRSDDDCCGKECDDDANENHEASKSQFTFYGVRTSVVRNVTVKDDNDYGSSNVHGLEEEKDNEASDFDNISTRNNDITNVKINVSNQIGKSGSFSHEKKFDDYDLYLRNCFEGNEENSDSYARRILKSHTKLELNKSSPNFRIRFVRACAFVREMFGI